MIKLKQFMHDQKGSSLVFVSISIVLLLGFTGLVVDFGKIYVIKTDLQKTANAAALSGAQELINDETKVEEVVGIILDKHGQQNNLEATEINIHQDVTVLLSEKVPLFFLKIFGLTNIDVPVRAKAEIKSIGSATGVAPLGIDESVGLNYFETYTLKVGPNGQSGGNGNGDENNFGSGFFGALDLGRHGASNYENNLRHGYNGVIKIGDIIETKTGNMAQPTIRPIQERINGCEHDFESGREIPRDCSRIILVPVYRPLSAPGNQLKEIEVVGFAYFYIMNQEDDQDTSITGMFIKHTGTGSINDDEDVDYGAYGIRLIE
ncbi:Tad domain-containing protein [Chengkuizengella sp. SCS-71B]|uniref:Tad domain-containing protein n=1 Tax=Chengkuizengella sp. SCS-71B TaxID=3115290 RepID=UPI0032C22C1B